MYFKNSWIYRYMCIVVHAHVLMTDLLVLLCGDVCAGFDCYIQRHILLTTNDVSRAIEPYMRRRAPAGRAAAWRLMTSAVPVSLTWEEERQQAERRVDDDGDAGEGPVGGNVLLLLDDGLLVLVVDLLNVRRAVHLDGVSAAVQGFLLFAHAGDDLQAVDTSEFARTGRRPGSLMQLQLRHTTSYMDINCTIIFCLWNLYNWYKKWEKKTGAK